MQKKVGALGSAGSPQTACNLAKMLKSGPGQRLGARRTETHRNTNLRRRHDACLALEEGADDFWPALRPVKSSAKF